MEGIIGLGTTDHLADGIGMNSKLERLKRLVRDPYRREQRRAECQRALDKIARQQAVQASYLQRNPRLFVLVGNENYRQGRQG